MDRKSRIFLRYMDKQPQKEIYYFDDPEYPKELGSEDDVRAIIRFLEGNGYLEPITSSNSGTNVGICLSHKGRNRLSFAWQNFLHYVEEKWIDFFALLAAIVALVVSIVALQQ